MSYPEDKIRDYAENLYRRRDSRCTEAVLRTFLDCFETEYDESVLNLTRGFPGGMGDAGCSCGAVVGGVMVLGMFFGQNLPKDSPWTSCMKLSKMLHDQFRETHKALCCRVLNHGLVHGSPEQRAACTKRIGDATSITLRIMEEEALKRGWQDKIRCKIV